jgi:hypothetical protein
MNPFYMLAEGISTLTALNGRAMIPSAMTMIPSNLL